MRARLALVIAVSVVFAPAWAEFEWPGGQSLAGVAARMLAPTFDEAALQTAPGPDKLARASDGKRLELLLTSRGGRPPTPSALSLATRVWLIGISLPELRGSLHAQGRSTRGPPYLQLS